MPRHIRSPIYSAFLFCYAFASLAEDTSPKRPSAPPVQGDHSQTKTSPTSSTGVHPWLNAGDQLKAQIVLDGKGVAELDYVAKHDGMIRQPALTFTVPAQLRRLRLHGKLIPAKGKPQTFDLTWSVCDIAGYTAPLYDTQLAFPERIRKFTDRLVAEANQSQGALSSPVTMQKVKQDPTKSLDALEVRLNVQLPKALRALSHYEISIDDSYFVKPTELTTVLETLSQWGYPKQGPGSLDKILSPATRARYERSLLVFTEVGDGQGGLAWDPRGVTDGEPSNLWVDKHTSGAKRKEPNTGVWFWLHQDNIDTPELLLDVHFQPRSAEDALLNAFQRFAVDQVVDNFDIGELKEPFLILDSAHPHGFLQLYFEGDNTKPKLWLRSYHSDSYSLL